MSQVIFKRLDRVLGNRKFCEIFSSLKVSHLDWYGSDHQSICVEFGSQHQAMEHNYPNKFSDLKSGGLMNRSVQTLSLKIGMLVTVGMVWFL